MDDGGHDGGDDEIQEGDGDDLKMEIGMELKWGNRMVVVVILMQI